MWSTPWHPPLPSPPPAPPSPTRPSLDGRCRYFGRLDPAIPLCRTELQAGSCSTPGCRFQHLATVSPSLADFEGELLSIANALEVDFDADEGDVQDQGQLLSASEVGDSRPQGPLRGPPAVDVARAPTRAPYGRSPRSPSSSTHPPPTRSPPTHPPPLGGPSRFLRGRWCGTAHRGPHSTLCAAAKPRSGGGPAVPPHQCAGTGVLGGWWGQTRARCDR
jgi:hypothetical protein